MILDFIASLPPLARLFAYLLPIVVFVAWGPWAWVLGGGLAMLAARSIGGTDVVFLALAVGGLVGYLLNCRWNPMGDCWFCKGSSKRRDSRKHFHWCFVCGGSGRRYRLGAYAWPKYREKASE